MKPVRLALLAATASVLALLPTAADADTLLRTDATGDVQTYTWDEETEEESLMTLPDRKTGDITKFRVTHTVSAVRVQVYYRALPKSGYLHEHLFRLVTNKFNRTVDLAAGDVPGGWTGRARVFNANGYPAPCPGVQHRIDYAHSSAVVNVPRSCLGYPQFVKVGVAFVSITADDEFFFDDGEVAAGDDEEIVLGPGVRRDPVAVP